MKKTLFALLMVALAVSSCGTARYYAGFTPASAGKDVALLGPVSGIFYLDEKNVESFSDSLSLESEELIAGMLSQINAPVSSRIELDDQEKDEVAAFMNYLKGYNQKQIGDLPIPEPLDFLLEAEGQRYGLIVFSQGMTRDRKGYVKEAVKGAAMGIATAILSLGMISVYSAPVRNASHIYTAIIDSEEDRIVFYNQSTPEESDPFKPEAVRKQLSKLLKDFIE